MMNFMKKVVVFIAIFFVCDVGWAQDNKKKNELDINEFMLKMEELAKQEKANKSGGSTTNRGSGRSGNLKASYERLTEAEKAQVKDLPTPPDVIRTADQAQDILDKLKGVDLMKRINDNKSATMQLKIYLIGYQNLQQNAQRIVRGAAKAKADFQKNNPNINFGDAVGKVYLCKNDLVYLPLGDISFADEVVTANYGTGKNPQPEQNCLNPPDAIEISNGTQFKGVYSLGLGGSIVIKFTNNALVDVSGTDLYVFELGEIEPTNLDISTDGVQWLNVGKISGGIAEVDISTVAKPNEYYYYVRLTDLKSTSTVPGADVDAVAAIGGAMRMSLNAEVLFDSGKSELKPEGIEAVKKLATQLTEVQKATLNIAGYTDDIGSDATNQKLSLARAESVAKVLKQSLNSKTQFTYKTNGYGKQNPAVPNNNDENRKKNRRVEILVAP
jgi:outer membrane protein OmpA-like peptidoglycan-associated protein